jgi:hypothetical protein
MLIIMRLPILRSQIPLDHLYRSQTRKPLLEIPDIIILFRGRHGQQRRPTAAADDDDATAAAVVVVVGRTFISGVRFTGDGGRRGAPLPPPLPPAGGRGLLRWVGFGGAAGLPPTAAAAATVDRPVTDGSTAAAAVRPPVICATALATPTGFLGIAGLASLGFAVPAPAAAGAAESV